MKPIKIIVNEQGMGRLVNAHPKYKNKTDVLCNKDWIDFEQTVQHLPVYDSKGKQVMGRSGEFEAELCGKCDVCLSLGGGITHCAHPEECGNSYLTYVLIEKEELLKITNSDKISNSEKEEALETDWDLLMPDFQKKEKAKPININTRLDNIEKTLAESVSLVNELAIAVRKRFENI